MSFQYSTSTEEFNNRFEEAVQIVGIFVPKTEKTGFQLDNVPLVLNSVANPSSTISRWDLKQQKMKPLHLFLKISSRPKALMFSHR